MGPDRNDTLQDVDLDVLSAQLCRPAVHGVPTGYGLGFGYRSGSVTDGVHELCGSRQRRRVRGSLNFDARCR